MAMPANLKQGIANGRTGQKLYAVTVIKQSIRGVNAVASKQLVNTVDATLSTNLTSLKAGTVAKQGYWIEYGRKPNKPVPAWEKFKLILRAWAAAKGLLVDDSGLWFIAKKIREKGWPGRFPVKKARDAMSPGLKNILAQAIVDKLR